MRLTNLESTMPDPPASTRRPFTQVRTNRSRASTLFLALGLSIALAPQPCLSEVSEFEAAYNAYGERTAFELKGGSTISLNFGEGGLPERQSLDSRSVIDEAVYDCEGMLERLDYATGHSGQYGFDGLGRFESLRLLDEEEQELSAATEMNYDQWGHLASQKRKGGPIGPAETLVAFSYTDLGQLESFSIGNSTSTYSYDGRGNLLSKSGLAGAGVSLRPFSVDASQYDLSNRPVGWHFDDAGRMIEDDQFRYRFNEAGRLALVLDKATGDVVAHYLYDTAGDRVRTFEDERVTYSLRSEGMVVWETVREPQDTRLIERRSHVEFGGAAVLTETETADGQQVARYRFTDRLGNPAVRWEEHGGAYTYFHQEYSPFGEQMILSPPDHHLGPHGFTGHEDDETGSIYMRARYYDPVWSRFNRPDPARDFNPYQPASANLYQYAANNPLAYTDPTGLKVEYADEKTRKFVEKYRASLDPNSQDYKNLERLEKSEITFLIAIERLKKVNGTRLGGVTSYNGEQVTITVAPEDKAKFSLQSNLAHEIEHGVQVDRGELGFNQPVIGGPWKPMFYDLGDEVAAWEAQVRNFTKRDRWHEAAQKLKAAAESQKPEEMIKSLKKLFPFYSGVSEKRLDAPKTDDVKPGQLLKSYRQIWRVPKR